MSDGISRSADLPVPVWQVWEHLVQSELLAGWLADEGAIDPVAGGAAWFRMGDQILEGWVEEARAPGPEDPAGVLVYWWSTDDQPATRVAVSVSPIGDGSTAITIEETRPLDALDVVGVPLPGQHGRRQGPTLVAT